MTGLAVGVLLVAACEPPAPEEPSTLGVRCSAGGDCAGSDLCVGANGCGSGMCSRACSPAEPCPSGWRCVRFQSVDDAGEIVEPGYCLRACSSNADCAWGLCSAELRACVTASLRYDLGEPVVAGQSGCAPLATSAGVFGASASLTDPGDLFVFGPALALDPHDADVRYVAYNSAAGTDVSVSHDGGATWKRSPIATDDSMPNIGDPGLAVDPATGEVWHSFLTAASLACTLDGASATDNAIGLVSSRDQGATWSAPQLAEVGPYATGFFVDRPSVVVGGGALHVVFVAVPAQMADPHTDVVVAETTDRGGTWSVTTVGDPARAVLRRAPAMAMAGDGDLITWFEKQDESTSHGSIWVGRASMDSSTGAARFIEQKVSGDLFATEDGPTIVSSESGATVIVVFGASAVPGLAPEDVYLVRSTDSGATFGQPERLTHACGSAWSPAATLDGTGALWVFWYQNVSGTSHVAWLEMTDPATSGTAPAGEGVLGDSSSPFTTSRSPLVSLGDFLGVAASGGVVAAAWTSLTDVAEGGGVIYATSSAN